ncbi:MAG: hypothetical protein PHD21_04040 [Flavobacteriales bacterium]|nr:hypothetical protein [Flavobacteriales bacterium]
MYRQEESKLIAGLAIGALIGVGVTYLVFTARRGHWLQHMQSWAGKVKQDMSAMEEKCTSAACHCDDEKTVPPTE